MSLRWFSVLRLRHRIAAAPQKAERSRMATLFGLTSKRKTGPIPGRGQQEIGPKMAATKQELGQFGGGGYD